MGERAPKTYSERLGSIDDEQLQRACDLFDLGALRGASPATAGLWGQNILIETARGEFVLRGNPQDPEQFAREEVVAGVIHAGSSLPVPWPYWVCDDLELFGWPFAIMPRLPGMMGSTLWEMADDPGKLGLAAAHGRALSRLHEAGFDAPGPFDAQARRFVAIDHF